MNRQEITAILKSQGWTEDRFGNLKSKLGGVRVKFQATSLRVEKKITHKPISFGEGSTPYTPPPEWVNIVSDYYKGIVLVGDRVTIKGRGLVPQK